MKKKFLLSLIVITLSILAFGAISVFAATEGIYTYSVSNGKAIITYCDTSASGEIAIPDTLGGYPVTAIGYEAFYNCTEITSIIIPNSVISIGDWSFSKCTGLIILTIPDSVTSIGEKAFYNCTRLTSITIGNGLATIKKNAFSGCTALEKVNITDIAAWCNIEFSYYASNPLGYANNLYVNGEIVTKLEIPKTVTSINSWAFVGCTELTSVIMPDSVITIGGSAFENCSNLTSISISNNITRIENSTFSGCGGLANISIPDGVTYIGGYAFSNCIRLISVTIPDGVTYIGDYAFAGCTGLLSIIIPDSVISIGSSTFSNCTGLTSITLPKNLTSISNRTFYYCTGLTSIVIPEGVTTIGAYAFDNCSGLTNLTIPKSITSIASRAFDGCKLEQVNITDIAAWCNIKFENCESNPLVNAKKIYLNGKLVNNIIIPDGVTSIGNYAFSECSGLISVTIPDSVTSIGHDAFYYCKELTYITIGSGVELLLEKSFYSCSNLKYVCLSKNIKSIRNDAFNYCSNIEAVFYEGNESQWNEILFYNRNENLTNAKIIYNATKKTYNFETNCNAILPEITNYAIFDEPVVNNEGKTFIGWYDNATFSGEPVVFPYYGNVTTLYAAWTDRTGKSFDDALTAKENREYIITTNESGQIIYYEFVPKYTGKYRFYSTGIYDTYGYLYNSNREQINYIDDGGEGNNFYIEQELTAGETYYIGAKLYSGSGTFNLVIETDCIPGTKTICVTAADGNKIFMTIPSYLPENAQVILVCYNDGKFTEMSSSPNKNETIYFIAYEEFNSAKIMVWESFENMKPLCEVEVVQ